MRSHQEISGSVREGGTWGCGRRSGGRWQKIRSTTVAVLICKLAGVKDSRPVAPSFAGLPGETPHCCRRRIPEPGAGRPGRLCASGRPTPRPEGGIHRTHVRGLADGGQDIEWGPAEHRRGRARGGKRGPAGGHPRHRQGAHTGDAAGVDAGGQRLHPPGGGDPRDLVPACRRLGGRGSDAGVDGREAPGDRRDPALPRGRSFLPGGAGGDRHRGDELANGPERDGNPCEHTRSAGLRGRRRGPDCCGRVSGGAHGAFFAGQPGELRGGSGSCRHCAR